MWWLRHFHRTASLLVLVALLSSCGFSPLYLKGKQNAQPELTTIEISNIADRKGQVLKNMLIDQLTPQGQSAHLSYVLDVTVESSIRNLGVRSNDRATRAIMKVQASYSLLRTSDQSKILSGTSGATSGYDILDSDFATLSSQKDAMNHSLRAIAQDIKLRLSLLFSNDPGGNKAARKYWFKLNKEKEKQKRLEREEEDGAVTSR
jgi:LPS-assembly lipoprotein